VIPLLRADHQVNLSVGRSIELSSLYRSRCGAFDCRLYSFSLSKVGSLAIWLFSERQEINTITNVLGTDFCAGGSSYEMFSRRSAMVTGPSWSLVAESNLALGVHPHLQCNFNSKIHAISS